MRLLFALICASGLLVGASLDARRDAQHHRLARKAQITPPSIAERAASPALTPAAVLEKRACAATYKPTTSVKTITGTGTLPKATARVSQSSYKWQLGGKTFRPVGPNIYWLGLDENPTIAYPSHQRIREAMAIAVAMGANTVRSITLGVSVGRSQSVWPSLDSTNKNAFDAIDYSIHAAKQYGLRLIVPLTDNLGGADDPDYHGSKLTFLRWLGKSTANNGQLFYSDADTISAYKRYIKTILTHVNSYTNQTIASDTAILAFETGNELGAYMNQQGSPPGSWTNQICSYIKSLAPNAICLDGSNGLFDPDGSKIDGLSVSSVDAVSGHFYPANSALVTKEWSAAKSAGKAYGAFEYDWTGQHGGSSLSSFFSAIEATSYAGDLLWSVFGHDDSCCNYVQHNDGYSLYYPNGNSAALQKQILAVIKHWSAPALRSNLTRAGTRSLAEVSQKLYQLSSVNRSPSDLARLALRTLLAPSVRSQSLAIHSR